MIYEKSNIPGQNLLVGKIATFLFILILLIPITCMSEESFIHGTVRLENGEAPPKSITFNIIHNNRRVTRFSTGRSGEFRNTLINIKPGEDVIIVPALQQFMFDEPNRPFYYGYARMKTSSEYPMEIILHSVQTEPRYITIIDESGQNTPIKRLFFKHTLSMGLKKKDPASSGYCILEFDPNDTIVIYQPKILQGTYEFQIRSDLKFGDDYTGRYVLTADQLSKYTQREKPYLLKARRIPLSILVTIKWDPEFSIEPVQDKLRNMRLILIKNSEFVGESRIDQEGYARFYDISPGNYILQNGKPGSTFLRKYRITSETEKIVIPKDSNEMIRYTITIMPRNILEWKGVVIDKKTGRPIEDARIAYDGPMTKLARTGTEGRFNLPIAEGIGKNLIIKHSDYFPGQFALPLKREELEKIPQYHLEPFPILQGVVTMGAEKKSVPFARIRLMREKDRDFKARCNEKGEFSFPVAPNEYGFHIKAPLDSLVQVPSSSSQSQVHLYREPFTMPKADTTKNFHLGGIAKITINVTQNEESARIGLPKGICLLRENDTIMTGGAFTDASLMTIYVIEGKYKILIIDESEKLGALVGSVDATSDKENNIEARITAWRRIEHQTVGGYLDTLKMILGEPVTKKP